MASKKIPEAEVAELLVAAGAALGRRAWREARELCEQALAGGERADALELLAVASWWQDDVDAAIAARERAYVLRREHGETVEAARVAGFLAWDYGAMRGSTRLPTAGCNGRVGLQGSWNPRPSMRRFLAVAAGQLASMAGSAMTEFAVPIWIYLHTHSLVRMALFSAVALVPGIVVLPFAGAVVDRYSRRAVMLAGDCAAGVVQL